MTTTPADLLPAASAILPELIAIRRVLHARPEIGLHLPETQAAIATDLRALGLEPRLGTVLSSVVAVIEGTAPGAATGPAVLLRADMDALPLHEDSGLPFASATDGAMHACGHDTHVAMLLGGARLLLARRDRLAGSVILMFQPGEEGYHGARFMLEEGLLEAAGRMPSEAFALHTSTRYPSGAIAVRSGAMLASADTLRITVRGRGGHASAPHLALDPITVAADLVLGLQTMVGRRIDVFDPAVVTIAHVTAGTTSNIIPETAFLEGTIRTVSEETRTGISTHIRQLVAGTAAAHGAAADVEIEAGYPVTMNDPAAVERIVATATDLVGTDAILRLDAPIMGAEDFSYILQRVDGAMAFIGARPATDDPMTGPQNHSNRVVFEEAPMAIGAALHAAVALRALAPR
ncbi:MAG: amidohydrolase [Chloroflexi bacterium]|nr:amidohydrolase [Chloroflexota bacterium]